jgi:hypothetical protein
VVGPRAVEPDRLDRRGRSNLTSRPTEPGRGRRLGVHPPQNAWRRRRGGGALDGRRSHLDGASTAQYQCRGRLRIGRKPHRNDRRIVDRRME